MSVASHPQRVRLSPRERRLIIALVRQELRRPIPAPSLAGCGDPFCDGPGDPLCPLCNPPTGNDGWLDQEIARNEVTCPNCEATVGKITDPEAECPNCGEVYAPEWQRSQERGA